MQIYSCVSRKSFTVFILTFRPMLHLELIFVWGEVGVQPDACARGRPVVGTPSVELEAAFLGTSR